MPLRVLLDTNIYSADPRREKLPFETLAKLCRTGRIELYVPYIVEREFQTQLGTENRKNTTAIISAARGLLARGVPQSLVRILTELPRLLREKEAEIITTPEAEFIQWLEGLHAVRVGLTQEQALRALEAYFTGGAPLAAQKNREDIPDAVVYQTITELASEPLYCVIGDHRLRAATSKVANVTVYEGLSNFTDSVDVQKLIAEVDAESREIRAGFADGPFEPANSIVIPWKHNELLLAELRPFLKGDTAASHIREELSLRLMNTMVTSLSIPNDHHQAYVEQTGNVTELDFFVDDAHQFGKGRFSVPFTARVYVLALFDVVNPDELKLSGYGHHFKLQQGMLSMVLNEIQIDVQGFLRIIINESYEPGGNIEEHIDEFLVDSIEGAEIAPRI